MQTKYKIPKDVYMVVIGIIRGYERRKKEYEIKKDDIIHSSGASYITAMMNNNEMVRVYMPNSNLSVHSVTETKALALQALERKYDTQCLRIVDIAIQNIGRDKFENEEIRNALQKGILLNISDRRRYCYSHLNLPTIHKNLFYQQKQKFIYEVAKRMELI